MSQPNEFKQALVALVVSSLSCNKHALFVNIPLRLILITHLRFCRVSQYRTAVNVSPEAKSQSKRSLFGPKTRMPWFFRSNLRFSIVRQIGNRCAATVMTVLLSQRRNEPPMIHHQSQWSSENTHHLSIPIAHGTRDLVTACTSHLAGFLLTSVTETKTTRQVLVLTNVAGARCVQETPTPPPTTIQCGQLLGKKFSQHDSQTMLSPTGHASYFMLLIIQQPKLNEINLH